MIILGLTGSIGMGKSTTAEMFREEGIRVHDADAVVHALYQSQAVPLIEKAFPGSTNSKGVDRNELGKIVIGNPDAMKKLENIVHPLVKEKREIFLKEAKQANAKFVVLDIPLLFETNSEKSCDYVLVITASKEEQARRVLSRSGMNTEKFEKIKASQMSDVEKRKKADFIIDTSFGFDQARREVIAIIDTLINGNQKNA